MRQLLPCLLAALLVTCLTVALYDRVVARPARRLAVVDVAGVFRAKQGQFQTALVKAGSDAERERVMAAARAFGQRLPVALDEVAHQCACLLLDKSVLLGAQVEVTDLTDELTRKVE